MSETREKMSFFRTIAFVILFVPYLVIDLFHIATETTEYERKCYVQEKTI